MAMKYYKNVAAEYIASITTGAGQIEITREDYDEIMAIIRNAPKSPVGYVYMLRDEELTWELVELPPDPDDEE